MAEIAPVHTRIAELRALLSEWRRAGERIAFVPTMGSLHAGHLSLVEAARTRADRVVVSIYVNPLQFAAGEDFDAYPRVLQGDAAKLAPLGVDAIFAPTDQELYPRGRDGLTEVRVPGLSGELCGSFRAGHFEGVTTVVALLFNIVQPDVAVFGRKDYQQLAIIRRMAADLHFSVEIVGMPTLREASGLAMSSRNAYLSDDDRDRAAVIYASLCQTAQGLREGRRDFAKLRNAALDQLRGAGLIPQYFEIRGEDLAPADAATQHFVILVAAHLSGTRLIDNLELDLSAS